MSFKNFFKFSVLSLSLSVIACSSESMDSRPAVAFGTPLTMGASELQYSVLVLGSQAGCSGVAIGSRHVVTSAHCLGRFEDLPNEPRFILEKNLEIISFAGRAPETIRAIGAVSHPYHSYAIDSSILSTSDLVSSDIALIVLERPMQVSGIKIALPSQNLHGPLKLTGFGADENEFTNGRPRTAVSAPGWSSSKLHNGYGIVGFVRGDGVPCDGDKGAPAVSEGHLIGLVSMVVQSVRNQCRSATTSTLADVRLLRNWLKCSSEQLQVPLEQVKDAGPDAWCSKNSLIKYNL